MEINPFHNGHHYFLKQARKIANDGLLVCVISTNVVQRGEFSVLNKTVKTELLLQHGVDIVCELPTVWANQGGLYFAKAALKILQQFAITDLIFGSESNDLNALMNYNYQSANFKDGVHLSLANLQSNDILAISYIQAIKFYNLNVTIHPIKRIENNYNDLTITHSIASASAIRANINMPNIKRTLPAYAFDNILTINSQLLLQLLKVNLNNALDNQIDIFLSEQGQLLNKLNKALQANSYTSIDQLALACSDKNNSKYKLARVCLNTILMIENDQYLFYDYVRILGFNSKASKYLASNSFTSLADCNNPIAQIEARSSNLFSILTNNFHFEEFNRKPIIF